MNAAVVIPAYNHGPRVVRVVQQALALHLPVLVVDDGSTDATPEALAGIAGLTVLRHETNLGKGAAILTGLSRAADLGCDWALTIDADGQHDPADAPHLLDEAQKHGGRCLVLGRRQGMEAATVPWTSRFGRGFSNFWDWAAGGPKVADSQSGFRLYPVAETLALHVAARRYQFEVEVLVMARQAGLAVIETPVGVVYQGRGERVSHFRPWRDFLRNSSTFSRLIFLRIFGFFRPAAKGTGRP